MPKQSLEIDRTLIVSISHLTADDRQDLFDESTDLVVYAMGEYGYMVLARPVDEYASEERKHSNNLEKLLEFARKNDCDWLRFDVDANEIDGCEIFE